MALETPELAEVEPVEVDAERLVLGQSAGGDVSASGFSIETSYNRS